MGRKPGQPNATCITCGKKYHKAPSLKVIRCPLCRVGRQGMGAKHG